MKSSFTRTVEILALLGGGAVLVGFLFFPFGEDAYFLRMVTGTRLIQHTGASVQGIIMSPQYRGDPSVYSTYVSYVALWAIPVLTAFLVLFALTWIVRQQPRTKFDRVISPLAIILSAATIAALFLAFANFPQVSEFDLFNMMFSYNPPFEPIISSGWWISVGGAVLALVASILVSVGRRSDVVRYAMANPNSPGYLGISPHLDQSQPSLQPQLSALEILQLRFARGEIDAQAYQEMRAHLEASTRPHSDQ